MQKNMSRSLARLSLAPNGIAVKKKVARKTASKEDGRSRKLGQKRDINPGSGLAPQVDGADGSGLRRSVRIAGLPNAANGGDDVSMMTESADGRADTPSESVFGEQDDTARTPEPGSGNHGIPVLTQEEYQEIYNLTAEPTRGGERLLPWSDYIACADHKAGGKGGDNEGRKRGPRTRRKGERQSDDELIHG